VVLSFCSYAVLPVPALCLDSPTIQGAPLSDRNA
jgi:hypothetical protein